VAPRKDKRSQSTHKHGKVNLEYELYKTHELASMVDVLQEGHRKGSSRLHTRALAMVWLKKQSPGCLSEPYFGILSIYRYIAPAQCGPKYRDSGIDTWNRTKTVIPILILIGIAIL
jgi:hypothetical protein